MYDYGTFSFESKAQVLEQAKKFWNPDKTQFWTDAGVDLVIDRREGYFLWDMSGRRLIDMHLNGGTYNLGHRNPEVMQALIDGNASTSTSATTTFRRWPARRWRRRLIESAPASMTKVAFGSGGGEAIDIALKSARHATQRRKIVSIVKAYHGHTGLAVATGDDRFAKLFLSDRPDEFIQVPFGDVDAMEQALAGGDVAAVIMETIPATYGFPLPPAGYLEAVKDFTERYGALYIADEVQTGLMRTGEMWGITKHGIEPDIIVTGKGLSGGMYPITAAMLGDRAAQWLDEDGFAPHLDIRRRRARLRRRHQDPGDHQPSRGPVAWSTTSPSFFATGLRRIQADYPDWFVGIRQNGVVIGLEFDHPEGAKFVMRELYENGVWAIFSTLDPRVLQFKPGLLLSRELCEDVLDRARGRGRAGPARATARRGRRAVVDPMRR